MSKYIFVILLFISCKTKQDTFDLIIESTQNQINYDKNDTYIFIPYNMCNSCRSNLINYINIHPNSITCIIISDTKKEFEKLKSEINSEIKIYHLKNNKNTFISDTNTTVLKTKERQVKSFENNNLKKIIQFLKYST